MKITQRITDNRFSTSIKNRRGAMIVLIAVMFVILLVTLTFSVDVAYMQLSRTELRAATDAAARAGTEALSRLQSEPAARAAAIDIAAENKVAGVPLVITNADITLGQTSINPIGVWNFNSGLTPENAVRVNGERTSSSASGPISLFFGGMFGIYDYEPVQVAVASQLDRDVAIVVDRSGSMGWYNRWDGLSDAIDVFISEIDNTEQTEYLSLSSYTTGAVNNQTLTADTTLIADEFDLLYPDAWTNIGGGLIKGTDSLQNDPLSRPYAAKTIILMTDGWHNTGTDPYYAAGIARDRGHTVHTIAFGSGANSTLMEDIANMTGGRFFQPLTNQELIDTFREIALTLPVILTE